MASTGERIRTNILYGAIALLPLAALGYILVKLIGFLKKISEPLAPYVGLDHPYLGTLVLILAGVVVLLVICFLFGAIINTQLGAVSFKRIDARLRAVVPGYEIISNVLIGIAGNQLSYPPALITLDSPGTAVLGFVMEDDDAPHVTVFVPSAPLVTAGAIYVVERSRVLLLERSSVEAANCITQWGIGLHRLRGVNAPPEKG